MGSGSKSRVRVGFGYHFSGSGRVRVSIFGFLSGSGKNPRVFGYSGFQNFVKIVPKIHIKSNNFALF